nr:von Willebrand factor type A domain-containing protein [Pyrinomonadaceae bacterium]
MKQFSIARNQLLVGLLVFSIVFPACSSKESAVTTNSNLSEAKTTQNQPAYSSSNTMANTSVMTDASAGSMPLAKEQKSSGERYAEIEENPFLESSRAPLSTFSIDVDTASYANVRRYLNDGQLPPKDAVRIEELINYFEYDYPQPVGDVPFSVNTEVATAPWNAKHKIVQIGLQGKKVSFDNVPPSNLVFLIDVSGSMDSPERLPLVKQGLRLLVNQLSNKDRVAIVVYAGASGLVLPSTNNKGEILNALNNLEAGGS